MVLNTTPAREEMDIIGALWKGPWRSTDAAVLEDPIAFMMYLIYSDIIRF